MLINKELWFADPDTFNDPFDCRFDPKPALQKAIEQLKVDHNLYKDLLPKKLNSARVCCFSETKKNQLMWAHYAQEHNGFCIGFNVRKLLVNNHLGIGVLPVEYKSRSPYQHIIKSFELLKDLGGDISPTNLREEFTKRALATKYTGWKYEKEVRLISTKVNKLNFLSESINSITFGLKMNDKNKDTLKSLLSGKEWAHIKWFETSRAKDRFALNFNLL